MPLIVVALAGLGTLASTSLAGSARSSSCTPHNSIGASSFDYVLCGLPDLDQIREITPSTPGLPGDGYNYCAPTSTMDALAWFASNGVPALRPGNKDWTAPANYNEMSADIKDLGDLMGTTAAAGTTTGYYAGLEQWLTQAVPGASPPTNLVVPSYLWVSAADVYDFAPTLAQMAQDAAAGNIVLPNIMFTVYEKPPKLKGPKQWFVTGGHVLAMSSAKSPSTIGWHDPTNPYADRDYQSPYAEEKYTLTPVTATFGYVDPTTGKDDHFKDTILRVDNYFLDSSFKVTSYLWGYSILSPETVTLWLRDKITLVAPVRPGDPVESFVAHAGQPVVDLAVDPAGARDFYVTQGSSTIWALNTANGRSTAFASAGSEPRLIGYAGRSRTLYVVERGRLTALREQRKRTSTIASSPLSEQVDAVAVDQNSTRLLTLSAESGRLRIYDPHLRLAGTVQLPAAALAGTGNVSMALRDNVVYVHRDGRPAVLLATVRDGKLVGTRAVHLAGADRPAGLAVNDAGHIFVQSGGKLAEYGPTGRLLASSQFNGKAAGASLVVNRTFSNAPLESLPFLDRLPPKR